MKLDKLHRVGSAWGNSNDAVSDFTVDFDNIAKDRTADVGGGEQDTQSKQQEGPHSIAAAGRKASGGSSIFTDAENSM